MLAVVYPCYNPSIAGPIMGVCQRLRALNAPAFAQGSQMARYFFHMIDGVFQPDTVGEEFETLSDARNASMARASTAIEARGAPFWQNGEIRLVITDGAGDSQFELTLGGRSYSKPPEA